MEVPQLSPTVANIYRGNLGLMVVCASCLNGRGFRNPGLPTRFRHQWHLTLLDLEGRLSCNICGAHNARVGPW